MGNLALPNPHPPTPIPLVWLSRRESNRRPPGFNRLLYRLSYATGGRKASDSNAHALAGRIP